MSGGGGGGAGSNAIPPISGQTQFQNQYQPQADTGAFSGIGSLGSQSFYRGVGEQPQQSLVNPNPNQFNWLTTRDNNQANALLGSTQGTSTSIWDQINNGLFNPANYVPQNSYGRSPAPPSQPQGAQTPTWQSAITPQMAQEFLGAGGSGGTPGPMGGTAGTGAMTQDQFNTLSQMAWGAGSGQPNQSNDMSLAQAMYNNPGGGGLSAAQLAELQGIAGQTGYGGTGTSGYGYGGTGTGGYQAGTPGGMGTGANPQMATSGGAGGTTFGAGQSPSTGAPGGTGGSVGVGGGGNSGQASGFSNPAADVAQNLMPAIAAMGSAMGPQGQALQAYVLNMMKNQPQIGQAFEMMGLNPPGADQQKMMAGLMGQAGSNYLGMGQQYAQQSMNDPYANQMLGAGSQMIGQSQTDPTIAAQRGAGMGLLNQSQNSGLQGDIGQILQQGFDPQNALYSRTLQQVQDQTRAGLEARGLDMSPYGAGTESDAMKNFNIDWQNNLLNRENTAATGASTLGGLETGLAGMGNTLLTGATGNQTALANAGAGLSAGGTGRQTALADIGTKFGSLGGSLGEAGSGIMSNLANQSSTYGNLGRQILQGNVAATEAAQQMGQSGLTSEIGALQGVQAGALGAQASTQQQISDYLAYLGQSTSQNSVNVSAYKAMADAANAAQANSQQASQAGDASMMGMAKMGLGVLGK